MSKEKLLMIGSILLNEDRLYFEALEHMANKSSKRQAEIYSMVASEDEAIPTTVLADVLGCNTRSRKRVLERDLQELGRIGLLKCNREGTLNLWYKPIGNKRAA